jgi:hypothetical protein
MGQCDVRSCIRTHRRIVALSRRWRERFVTPGITCRCLDSETKPITARKQIAQDGVALPAPLSIVTGGVVGVRFVRR